MDAPERVSPGKRDAKWPGERSFKVRNDEGIIAGTRGPSRTGICVRSPIKRAGGACQALRPTDQSEMLKPEIPESFKQAMAEIARGNVINLDEALQELDGRA